MVTLADAILQEDIHAVQQHLRYGEDVNQIDEYGFRPLIEAAIVENVAISELLLASGANPNLPDVTGGTALHWAAENNNLKLARMLLKHHADPNLPNLAGMPALVMPTLRGQQKLKQLLVKAGADQAFAQDFINTKLLGHLFELVGIVTIVGPNKQFIEVDLEGFFLEITLGLVADALHQFQNHFAARQLRRFTGLAQFIVDVISRAAQLIRYQQYRVEVSKHRTYIEGMLKREPVLIPVGYEGHAITFISYGDIWVKCDRREDSRLYDTVTFYRVTRPEQLTVDLIMSLEYEKQSDRFINEELDHLLGLELLTELKIEAQVSGNCSWANVEAAIPAIFFLVLMQLNKNPDQMAHHKSLALNYFHRWRDWNKDRALDYCLQRFREGDDLRKAANAEVLAAILFQRCNHLEAKDQVRIEKILNVLQGSPYEYLLHNYLRVYYYESYTQDGKRFSALLKHYGVIT